MEMTIDEVIKELEWALANNTIEDVESAFKYISAIHMAMDTMRKYQKIEQIVKEWREVGLEYDSCDAMMNIERVIEDGTDHT